MSSRSSIAISFGGYGAATDQLYIVVERPFCTVTTLWDSTSKSAERRPEVRPPLLDETLHINLRKLELMQLERRLDAVLEEKDFAEKSFKEQLNQLLEEEVGFRQERAIKMRLKLARFPVVKTIDALDFTFQPELDKESVLSLFSLTFVQDKSNIVFIGPSGVVKTHLAIALGVAACQGGYTAYFTTFQTLLENLRKAEEQNRLRRKLQSYSKPHELVVDELAVPGPEAGRAGATANRMNWLLMSWVICP